MLKAPTGDTAAMKTKANRSRPTVVLALGWYVNEIVAGVARYARESVQ